MRLPATTTCHPCLAMVSSGGGGEFLPLDAHSRSRPCECDCFGQASAGGEEPGAARIWCRRPAATPSRFCELCQANATNWTCDCSCEDCSRDPWRYWLSPKMMGNPAAQIVRHSCKCRCGDCVLSVVDKTCSLGPEFPGRFLSDSLGTVSLLFCSGQLPAGLTGPDML